MGFFFLGCVVVASFTVALEAGARRSWPVAAVILAALATPITVLAIALTSGERALAAFTTGVLLFSAVALPPSIRRAMARKAKNKKKEECEWTRGRGRRH